MLEKPDLRDEEIRAFLQSNYDLHVTEIEFLPLGNDSSAWSYKVAADDGTDCFLKVRTGRVHESALVVPRHLKDIGIEQIVAPLLTTNGELWVTVDKFTLILYPFIAGGTGKEIGMSDRHWIEFGAVLKTIHATRLSHKLSQQISKETFSPKWSGMVKALQAQVMDSDYDNPLEQKLAAFWKDKHNEIMQIVERTEALGRILQNTTSEFVLCHADIHSSNIMLNPAGEMFIVDWDETLLAPKERDLMFVCAAESGAVMHTREENLFFSGYGKTEIDSVAIAYYRYEWVVQEIGDFGERVFVMDDIGVETKADSVRGFMALFQAGDVVDAAYKSEEDLPPEVKSWQI